MFMRRRDYSFTIGLCISMLMHGLLLRMWYGQWLQQMTLRMLENVTSVELAVRHEEPAAPAQESMRQRATPAMQSPATGKLQTSYYVVRNEPLPLVTRRVLEELPPLPSEMGERAGKGFASNSSPGDEPMRALEGDEDQAFLSRDPAGLGRVGSLPSKAEVPQGQGGNDRPVADNPGPGPFGINRSVVDVLPVMRQPLLIVPQPKGLPQATPMASKEKMVPTDPPPVAVAMADSRIGIRMNGLPPRPPAERPVITPVPPTVPTLPRGAVVDAVLPEWMPTPSVPSPQPVNKGGGGSGPSGLRGNVSMAAADPAPMSDSESDAFSKIGSASFQNGRLEARFGRKVKTVRPRLMLGGAMALPSLATPWMVLSVTTDVTGQVTNVDIIRSSGSNEVDLPVQRAMYEWWIEPPLGKDGKPKADVMIWRITFR